MRTTLRYASRGPDVELVQCVLNAWNEDLTPLAVDGIYGPKTTARVKSFQGSEGLGADGVVGPNTWGALEPLIEAFENSFVAAVPPPAAEQQARDRIVAWAQFELSFFGWRAAVDAPGPLNLRIRSTVCADPASPLRPRQGGIHLAQIFHGAGHPKAPSCLSISQAAETFYKGKDDPTKQNQIDLPDWCGIFALHLYRMAGLKLRPWPLHNTTMEKNAELQPYVPQNGQLAKTIRKGDIGVLDGIRAGGRNHHFVVTDVSDTAVTSVDGNATIEIGQGKTKQYLKGVIRTVKRHAFDPSNDYFLRPVWSRVLP
jgi:Putative peptidoglycan binding domain